jgi:hypothetical protein
MRSIQDQLFDLIASCAHDPLKFVQVAYPWLEPGPLLHHAGPDDWQADVLAYVRDNLGKGRPLRLAIAGGVGPGKSAVGAWIINWAMTTCVDCRCRITANTGPQISTATWPEISKWFRMSLANGWFELGDRRLRSVDPAHKESWRADAITWDEQRPEAFAGFHNAGRRIVYLFDESAAIADSIFKEAEGIMSGGEDTEIIFICLGNPTRNDTMFRTFFAGGKNARLWKSWHIDTRTARMSDKAQIQEWIDSYGIDSDFVRVRVLSQFPRVGSMQFIGTDLIEAAASPNRRPDRTVMPLVMGVDVARFGDDMSVICFRRGRDARSMPMLKYRGLDTMGLAARVADLYFKHYPDAIFIDGGGVGGGVVDRCRMLHLPIQEVQFGARPDLDQIGQEGAVVYANRRAAMWGAMREWLAGGALPDDPDLKAELSSVLYGYTSVGGVDAIILERKTDMKKRGLASPDSADALALTFAAYPMQPSDQKPKVEETYDPFQHGHR